MIVANTTITKKWTITVFFDDGCYSWSHVNLFKFVPPFWRPSAIIFLQRKNILQWFIHFPLEDTGGKKCSYSSVGKERILSDIMRVQITFDFRENKKCFMSVSHQKSLIHRNLVQAYSVNWQKIFFRHCLFMSIKRQICCHRCQEYM